MSVPEFLPLFVFGTLRRGECNHHYLAGHYERMIPATLSGYARCAELMIRRESGGEVRGELCFIRETEFAEAMAGCDLLEGLSPGEVVGEEYQRIQVTVRTVEGEFVAWAYTEPE